MTEDCSICGLSLDDKYSHQLKCNHTFHYECLVKTFLAQPNKNAQKANSCPYCREKVVYLPVVNGLKKMTLGIHCHNPNSIHVLENTPCKFILTRGKNKGEPCNKNCALGYDYCKVHKNKFD